MRKLATVALLGTLCLGLSGCFTLSWAHNRRHIRKVIDEMTLLHQDIDKIIFGLDRNPAE
jgi:hypothetical protein